MDKIKVLLLSPEARADEIVVIGYCEFISAGQLEREYWLSLDAAKFDKFDTADQMLQQKEQSLCVVHVQYTGTIAVSS